MVTDNHDNTDLIMGLYKKKYLFINNEKMYTYFSYDLFAICTKGSKLICDQSISSNT